MGGNRTIKEMFLNLGFSSPLTKRVECTLPVKHIAYKHKKNKCFGTPKWKMEKSGCHPEKDDEVYKLTFNKSLSGSRNIVLLGLW